jgi:hypothetical protein
VVNLIDASTGQPVLVNGQPVTVTTDANGNYLFSGLVPGDYFIVFDVTTLPHGYGPTMPNQGNDAVNSDADATGTTGNTGFLGSGSGNLNLDMGISTPDLIRRKAPHAESVLPGGLITHTLTYTPTKAVARPMRHTSWRRCRTTPPTLPVSAPQAGVAPMVPRVARPAGSNWAHWLQARLEVSSLWWWSPTHSRPACSSSRIQR